MNHDELQPINQLLDSMTVNDMIRLPPPKTTFLDLPPHVQLSILESLSSKDQFSCLTVCKEMSPLARTSLFTNLHLNNRKMIQKLMHCHPDPTKVAGCLKTIKHPGSLIGEEREYINSLINTAISTVEELWCFGLERNNNSVPYFPKVPKNHNIKRLIIGRHSRDSVSERDRIIPLSELIPFPNIT